MIESFGASGELSGFDFPKLLIYLNDNRFDGKLIVNINGFSKSLFINKGLIAYVVSNDPSDSLDTVIIKYGMLTSDVFKDAVEKAKAQQKSVAKYLIENNLLTSEDLIQASGLQIKEVIKNLITANDFAYFLKKDSAPENIPNQKVNPYQVTFDAFLNLEDISWIHKQLGSSKRIFVHSEDFVERYKNIFYSEDTDILVTRIDGKTDIETLIKTTGLDTDKVKKILAALFVMNMLKLVSDSPLDMAEPVLMSKNDTDTQQIQAELARKKAAQPALPTEKMPIGGIKSEEITLSKELSNKKPDFPSVEERDIFGTLNKPSLTYEDRDDTQSRRLAETGFQAQPVSSSTDQYLKILERQRKKTNRITLFTLILVILFGLTVAFYLFIYQKNIESNEPSRNETVGKNTPNEDSTQIIKSEKDQKLPGKNTVKATKTVENKSVEKESKTKPAATAAKTPGLSPYRNIGSLMASGNYQAAASAWRENLKSNPSYTISVEIACARDSITKIYSFDPKLENLFILPRTVKDKQCFRVCWGQFPDSQTAKSKIGTLPEYYRNQTPKPEPVTIKSIL